MGDLFAVLVPILIADVMNPVLLAALIFALGTAQPIRNGSALVAGHTFAYTAAGFAVALGLDAVIDWLARPTPLVYGLQALAGALLLWLAWWSTRPEHPERKQLPEEKKPSSLGIGSAFLLGAQINLVGIPFALPYFAAVERTLASGLGDVQMVAVLMIYNAAYALPFAVLVVLRQVMGESSEALFARVNGWMERASAVILPLLLIALGAALLADSVGWALGHPLFPSG